MVDDHDDSDGSGARAIDRRAFLGTVGVGTTLGVAGCLGDGSGDDGSGDDGSGDDGSSDDGVVETAFVTAIRQAPSEWDTLNQYADVLPDLKKATYTWYMNFHEPSNDFIPGILDDWEVTDETVTAHFDGDYQWSNGEAITAEDLYVHFQIDRYVTGWPASIDSVEAVDDETFRINLAEPVNEYVFLNEQLAERGRNAEINAEQYGEWVDRFEDAVEESDADPEDDDLNEVEEVVAVAEELTGAGDADPWMLEEPLCSGAFTVSWEDVGDTSVSIYRNENYHRKDEINWTEIRGEYYTEDQVIWQGMRNGDLHFTNSLYYYPPDVVETMGDDVLEVLNSTNSGLAAVPQTRDKWLDNYRVRQALMWAINSEQVASNTRPRLGATVDLPHGIYQGADDWLGDLQEDMTDYAPTESDTETAARILEEEGFSQEDGEWYTPDGERFSVPVYTSTDTSWANYGETVHANLEDFGIQSDLNTANQDIHWGENYTAGNYEGLAIAWHWGGDAYPYNGYDLSFRATHERTGHGWPKPPESDNPGEVELPPVGDPDGDLETYDVDDLLGELETNVSAEREEEVIRTLAWIFNQSMIKLHSEERESQNFFNTADWDLPEEGDEEYDVLEPDTFWYFLHTGQISAKTD